MKRLSFSDIPNAIGILNIIIVVVIYFCIGSPDYKRISSTLITFMSTYLKYAFIPAILSIVLSKVILKKLPVFNLVINILFLIVYTFFVFIIRNVIRHG